MKFIYAIDGDDIGKKIEQALFNNDLDLATKISQEIENSLILLNKEFLKYGAKTIFIGGDSLLLSSSQLIEISPKLLQCSNMTFSMGIACSPSEAVLALKQAKGLGKNRIVNFIHRKKYES